MLGDRSISTIDDLIARGKIQAVKDGKRTLPIVQSLIDYMHSLPLAKVKSTPRHKSTTEAA
jgi:hypothetical protein